MRTSRAPIGPSLLTFTSATKPGGYAELSEIGRGIFSGNNSISPALKIFFDKFEEAMIQIGRPIPKANTLRVRLIQAGFVDVDVVTIRHPLGPWSTDIRMKIIGNMVLAMSETLYEAYGMAAFTRILGMDEADAKTLCSEALEASKCSSHRAYINL